MVWNSYSNQVSTPHDEKWVRVLSELDEEYQLLLRCGYRAKDILVGFHQRSGQVVLCPKNLLKVLYGDGV